MSVLVPPARPKLASLHEMLATYPALPGLAKDLSGQFFLVGVAGYYSLLDGKPGNARNIYDDAIIAVFPDGQILTFNANVDPSEFRKGVATIVEGLHWYKLGNHGISKPGGGYPALRPASPDEGVDVTRDGQSGLSRGIAINIHKGSFGSTSSLGCQTIYPPQWDGFISLVTAKMKELKQKRVAYIKLGKAA